MTNPYASPEADLTRIVRGGEGVSEGVMEALRGTRKWVRLLGVLALVVSAITAVLCVGFVVVAGSLFAGFGARGYNADGALLAAVLAYGFMALLCGALGWYLVKYANAISRLLGDGKIESLENALQQQQKFWRLAGGVAMVMLLLTVVGIGAAVIVLMLER